MWAQNSVQVTLSCNETKRRYSLEKNGTSIEHFFVQFLICPYNWFALDKALLQDEAQVVPTAFFQAIPVVYVGWSVGGPSRW